MHLTCRPSRDAIYWLDNVRRTVTKLVFMLLVLPWFQVRAVPGG